MAPAVPTTSSAVDPSGPGTTGTVEIAAALVLSDAAVNKHVRADEDDAADALGHRRVPAVPAWLRAR